MVSETKLAEKWALKRLSSHESWGCWLAQYRERLDKEAGTHMKILSYVLDFLVACHVVQIKMQIYHLSCDKSTHKKYG